MRERLYAQLEAAVDGDYDPVRLQRAVDGIDPSDRPAAVATLITFMEDHPDADIGSPGPLIRYVEAFGRYEDELLASVARRPGPHNVWMLTRLINGTPEGDFHDSLTSALKMAAENPRAHASVRNQIADFLQEPG